MGLEIYGRVGPVPAADGAEEMLRLTKDSSQGVQDTHARYQEVTYRGGVFLASTQAGIALSLLSGTATGFILTNPPNSGKILSLIDVILALTTAPAGISSIYLCAYVAQPPAAITHTTPLSVRSARIGDTTVPVGLADSAATLPTAPVVIRPIGGGPVATGSVTSSFIRDEIAGSIQILPGFAVSVQALTTAISAIIGMSWEEILL